MYINSCWSKSRTLFCLKYSTVQAYLALTLCTAPGWRWCGCDAGAGEAGARSPQLSPSPPSPSLLTALGSPLEDLECIQVDYMAMFFKLRTVNVAYMCVFLPDPDVRCVSYLGIWGGAQKSPHSASQSRVEFSWEFGLQRIPFNKEKIMLKLIEKYSYFPHSCSHFVSFWCSLWSHLHWELWPIYRFFRPRAFFWFPRRMLLGFSSCIRLFSRWLWGWGVEVYYLRSPSGPGGRFCGTCSKSCWRSHLTPASAECTFGFSWIDARFISTIRAQ